MKNLMIICFAVFLYSCNQGKKKQQTTEPSHIVSEQQSEDFDWLIGHWTRLNEDNAQDTYEHWEKISATEYSGIGYTIQDGDTISQEKIKFIKVDAHWNLKVKAPSEDHWTTFKGTNHYANSFTCENTEIEFPNRIKYWIKHSTLHALVAGNNTEIAFEFEKTN